MDTQSEVVGVYSGNDLPDWAFFDMEDTSAGRSCPYCEHLLSERFSDECERCGEYIEWELYDSENTDWLIGDWIEEESTYRPDEKGEFAALYDGNMNIVQVVWSKTTRYGRPASICYPNQVDARKDDPSEPNDVCYIPYHAFPFEAQE